MGWWRDFTDRNLCFATFFSTKKYWKKKCPNIILISSRWSTECFKSDGRKTLQIEIFVLQHFFRKKTLETYGQISLQWFWNDPLNVLKAIVERCCSKMKLFNFKMNWNLLFCFLFHFLFLGARHGGSLVVPRCGSPLCLLSRGLPKDVSPPKDWWDFLFPPTRARARVDVIQFASRNLGDGKYLEGFGTQMIIKLWSYIISKLIDVLLLCVPQGAPPTNGGDPWFPMQILILGKSWIFNCLGKNIAPWNRTIFLLLLNERITFFEAS